MTTLPDLLERIRLHLTALGVDFALVGGLAVSVRTEPRFTRDVDLAVAVADDAEAERVVAELTANGWVLDEFLEQDTTHRLAAIRLCTLTGTGPVVDLLFASSGIEGEIVRASNMVEVFSGVEVPVATTGHLIALKELSSSPERPQDDVDLSALTLTLNDSERERALEAAELIESRGFDRGRMIRELVGRRVAAPDRR